MRAQEPSLSVWQKAFMRDQHWRKDELRTAVFWLVAAFSLALGAALGLLGLRGLPGFVAYFVGVVVAPSVYWSNFLGVDEDDFGGKMEILNDSIGSGAAMFLLAWTGIFTLLHGQ
ncbi:hypothetical protein IWW55_003337 [Coemansia sp. RSA 2706]|nr:hypothetical protein LPJ63_002282 [Coemansia sp. RSA 2711]KAJ1846325.1 hypothetical protein LPJ70_002094 [Coemansia sp. RSA 2708]KAJ2302609.1 hypothetical protein IWW55_003337 [Coemansia sp. RSA 2706]KAJ2312755.1 hypothetical protein IWW54_001907 [Coemansia sp. RSA 2705]KAJ2321544.1 hypothetical protein IWW52_000682 [Coemansia sp. RSA 2704]KAJ2323602.1 hypothetical protein IWW51_003676 [Coemansia sp. RSA 2702]KAJ2368000.1 hypothetical protein H4S01_001837 [Coemansia sp. RSA 2610]KAJ236940